MCSGYPAGSIGQKLVSINTGKLIPETPKVKGYPLCVSTDLGSREGAKKKVSMSPTIFGIPKGYPLCEIPVLTLRHDWQSPAEIQR